MLPLVLLTLFVVLRFPLNPRTVGTPTPVYTAMPAITTSIDVNFGQVKHCVACSLQKKMAPIKKTITIITPFINAEATAPLYV